MESGFRRRFPTFFLRLFIIIRISSSSFLYFYNLMERHLPNFIYLSRERYSLDFNPRKLFCSLACIFVATFDEKKEERTGRNSTNVHRLSVPC